MEAVLMADLPAFGSCPGCGGMQLVNPDGTPGQSWHAGECAALADGVPIRLQVGDLPARLIGAIGDGDVYTALPGFLRQVADEIEANEATQATGNEQAGG
jgi:hypothetical protein